MMRLLIVTGIVGAALLVSVGTGRPAESDAPREGPRRLAAAEHGIGSLMPDATGIIAHHSSLP